MARRAPKAGPSRRGKQRKAAAATRRARGARDTDGGAPAQKRAEEGARAARPTESNEDFLPEIRLAAKEEPLELCLSEEDTEDLAAPPVPPQPLPPPVPHPPVEPALPMVSQLVGELMGSLPEKDAD
ncbi:unnamed protein product [Durusdinium trenchii]|uniref:Uncharacterized protein n=1 Tax=Durusdinium trenchii TaxID=1381693 RepID=A0ABP0S4N6_9DINO